MSQLKFLSKNNFSFTTSNYETYRRDFYLHLLECKFQSYRCHATGAVVKLQLPSWNAQIVSLYLYVVYIQ